MLVQKVPPLTALSCGNQPHYEVTVTRYSREQVVRLGICRYGLMLINAVTFKNPLTISLVCKQRFIRGQMNKVLSVALMCKLAGMGGKISC